MLRNYLKISLRQLWRQKLFTGLNIFGLATSMSICLLLIMILVDQYSMDQFHVDKDRVYRVLSDRGFNDQASIPRMASSPIPIAEELEKNYSWIDQTSLLVETYTQDLKYQEDPLPMEGLFVEPAFLQMFSFGWLAGDQASSLLEPQSVVLTEETAQRLLGEEDPMGKMLSLGEWGEFMVKGVIPTPPRRSHIQFEFLVSASTLERLEKEELLRERLTRWANVYASYVYFSVKHGTPQSLIDEALARISQEQSQADQNYDYTFQAQAFDDIAPGNSQVNSNELGQVVPRFMLYALMGMGILIMLSACFNYANLSIARALKRSKEVGVRKVLGAKRGAIVSQFLMESVLIALFALVIAAVLLELLIPAFYGLDPHVSQIFYLKKTPWIYLLFIGFSVFVGVIAGILPALHLSAFQPVQVLRKLSNTQLFSHVFMRKALIVVQFCLSLFFVITTLTLLRQHKQLQETELGFETDNILNVELQEVDYEIFVNEVAKIPEVEEISGSYLVPAMGRNVADYFWIGDRPDSVSMSFNTVTQNYLSNMNMALVAGENFPKTSPKEGERYLLLNETAVKRFQLGTPQEAIGKQMFARSGSENKKVPLTILGVTRDFYGLGALNPINPYGLLMNHERVRQANIRVSGNNIPVLLEALKKTWKALDPQHAIEYEFFDEQVAYAFQQFTLIAQIVGLCGGLAIIIAALGLLGMVTYAVEGRVKEIGIRKTLGASERNLVWKLSQGFFLLLGIACVLAIPFSLFINQLLLQEVAAATRINPGIGIVLTAVAMIFGLGLLTVVSQTYIAAKLNPAEALRTE